MPKQSLLFTYWLLWAPVFWLILNIICEATLGKLPFTVRNLCYLRVLMLHQWSSGAFHPTLTSVTYGTSYHASGHPLIYRECYGFERTFFTLRCFLFCTSSCFSRLPWGQQFNLKDSSASCCGSSLVQVRLFVWITQDSTKGIYIIGSI